MQQHPNVLLLFSDQHNASVLGHEDHPDVLTPNLDQLAASGVRFSRAYCQDAICVPSRCSMLSGLYPRTLGCRDNGDHAHVSRDVRPMQQTFQQSGYITGAFGKRHLHAAACDRGWSVTAAHLFEENPHDNYVTWIHEQGMGEAFDMDWAAEFSKPPKGSPAGETALPRALMATRASALPDTMTMEAFSKDRTIAFLKERSRDDKPFFCWTSFYRPHQPYTPVKEYWDRFDRTRWGRGRRASDGVAMPPSLRQASSELPQLLQSQHAGGNPVWRLDLARDDEQLYRDYITAYYALVEEIDTHIGDILSSLDELALAENTIVIYTADHGDFVGAHGMVEKCATGHNVYEDTLRVPLILSWPKELLRNHACTDLAELLDIYPTLLDLCGLEQPDTTHALQGISLAATLRRGTPINRAATVSENWIQSTIITERYKYGHWSSPDTGNPHMLFDREQDPLELHNIAEEQPQLRDSLAARLREWKDSVPTHGAAS